MRVLLFSLLLLSCESFKSADFPTSELNKKTLTSKDEIWICHHPGTEYHGKVCVEEIYPKGCFVSGDLAKFCWKLTKKDCFPTLELEWQLSHCKLFEK